MSETSAPNPMQQIGHRLGEVAGFVAAMVAYLVALSGRSPGPMPKMTAVLTVMATTIALWVWRWPQIIRQKPAPEILSTEPIVPKSRSLVARLLDPFRSPGLWTYVLSLTRRRVEVLVLIALSLVTVAWTGFALPRAIPELSGTSAPAPLPIKCTDTTESNALRVVIADFDEVGPADELLLENRLFDSLSERTEEDMAICRLQQVIALRTEALALGEQMQAAIIVWGRKDVIFEVHLEVAGWELPGRYLPPLPVEIATGSDFQIREPKHLTFLVEFTFSEILYLDGQLERAQSMLSETLTTAEQEGLAEDSADELAEAYFMQGFLFDGAISPKPDNQRALVAYSRAFELDPTLYRAILNRGKVYEQLGDIDSAMADYALLIEEQSPLAASAHVNRAFLQPSREAAEREFESAVKLDPLEGHWNRGIAHLYIWNDPTAAVDDFSQAVKLNPTDFFFYHSLGQAQLLAGQTDAAAETYREITAHLNEDTRQIVIQELEMLQQDRPDLKETISTIISDLQAAMLPEEAD
jgi:tetratricopeptide (TPR) repeat protein